MMKYTKQEAVARLCELDHAFIDKKLATDIARALGIKNEVPVEVELDTRWLFKGLAVNKPDGYYDLHEFRKWMRENWSWVKNNVKRGQSQTRLVDELWMAYTKPDAGGHVAFVGIPYAEGIDATDFALWCCRSLAVPYHGFGGRGFQLQECCRVLSEHFGLKAVA